MMLIKRRHAGETGADDRSQVNSLRPFVYNVALNNGWTKVADYAALSDREMLSRDNVGPVILAELRAFQLKAAGHK